MSDLRWDQPDGERDRGESASQPLLRSGERAAASPGAQVVFRHTSNTGSVMHGMQISLAQKPSCSSRHPPPTRRQYLLDQHRLLNKVKEAAMQILELKREVTLEAIALKAQTNQRILKGGCKFP